MCVCVCISVSNVSYTIFAEKSLYIYDRKGNDHQLIDTRRGGNGEDRELMSKYNYDHDLWQKDSELMTSYHIVAIRYLAPRSFEEE